ncbi:c-type cytochrome [Nitratifractor sp.]
MKTAWILTGVVAANLMLWGADGAALAQKYGCMACHNIVGKKTAPAFRGVANRNMRFNGANAKSKIMQSIKNGSKGLYPNFPNGVMPPNPNIPQSDLETLADWILSQGMMRGRGMRGSMGPGQGMGPGRGMGQGRGMMTPPPTN